LRLLAVVRTITAGSTGFAAKRHRTHLAVNSAILPISGPPARILARTIDG
jgi:hypothetical protein